MHPHQGKRNVLRCGVDAEKCGGVAMKTLYSLAGAVIIFIIFFGEKFTLISFAVAIPVLILLYIAEWMRNRELTGIYPGRKRGE
jgi:hypothetical protein